MSLGGEVFGGFVGMGDLGVWGGGRVYYQELNERVLGPNGVNPKSKHNNGSKTKV